MNEYPNNVDMNANASNKPIGSASNEAQFQTMSGRMMPPSKDDDMENDARDDFESYLRFYFDADSEEEEFTNFMLWIDAFLEFIIAGEGFYIPVIPRPIPNEVSLYCPIVNEVNSMTSGYLPFIFSPVSDGDSSYFPIYTYFEDLMRDYPGTPYTYMKFPDLYYEFCHTMKVVPELCINVDDCEFHLPVSDIQPIFRMLQLPESRFYSCDGNLIW